MRVGRPTVDDEYYYEKLVNGGDLFDVSQSKDEKLLQKDEEISQLRQQLASAQAQSTASSEAAAPGLAAGQPPEGEVMDGNGVAVAEVVTPRQAATDADGDVVGLLGTPQRILFSSSATSGDD